MLHLKLDVLERKLIYGVQHEIILVLGKLSFLVGKEEKTENLMDVQLILVVFICNWLTK